MNLFYPIIFVVVIIECGAGSTNVIQFGTYENFIQPSLSNDTNKPDGMVVRCYNTICRDWMHECHWFCDGGKSGRCMECLSWRGQHCYDCFKLL